MLEALFGNRSAEKVLLFIGVNREAYAGEIATSTDTALSQVQAQLQRLERGGVLVSRLRGRMRFYSLNPRFPFSNDVADIARRAVDFLPDKDRDSFIVRRRPRARGKPLRRRVTR
jgi:DNA-binding transcriptional ArsR family regulator